MKFNKVLFLMTFLIMNYNLKSDKNVDLGYHNNIKKCTEIRDDKVSILEDKIINLLEFTDKNQINIKTKNGSKIRSELRDNKLIVEVNYNNFNLEPVVEKYTDCGFDTLINPDDSYEKRVGNKRVYLNLGLANINNKFKQKIIELANYITNPSGNLADIMPGDIGIDYPYSSPDFGTINWVLSSDGTKFTLIDIFFGGKIFDRLSIVNLNLENYKINITNDYKNSKTIEEWSENLNSDILINGSFFKSSPYGYPDAQIFSNNTLLGDKKYKKGGALLFYSKISDKKVEVIDSNNKLQEDLDSYNYEMGFTSYPVLYKANTINQCNKKNHKWRASRSFIGVDDNSNITVGNTENGFFSLWRLSNLLNELKQELNISKKGYILNLDGGPIASLYFKIDKISYINYGFFEGNDSYGEEFVFFNKFNKKKWKIPTVIYFTEVKN